MPEGAWDCHAHVLGDPLKYPLASGRDYEPPMASLEAYLAVLDALGIARGVLVQPSVYGFENRCLLDALDAAHGRLVGVAVPSPEATPADLEAMHRHGVRAVRCNRLNRGGLDPEVVVRWGPVLTKLGWHVELHLDLTTIEDLALLVERLRVPVVFDHMGRPAPGRAHVDDPIQRRLLALAGQGACYVKLSGAYRLTTSPAPWSDVAPLARTFLTAAPSACVWATDWPHTDTELPVHPDDLLATLDAWCPDATARRALMVETPTRLYGAG